jgi:two-component system NtrC family sensor kinase
MATFTEIIVRGEDVLLERILSRAEANGYLRFTSRDPEKWRPAIRGTSGSIVQAFRGSDDPPPLTADALGRDEGLTAFGVVESRKYRLAKMPLGVFLGLSRFFREAYDGLLRSAGFPPEEEERYRRYVERFFDRNEIAASVAWSMENGLEHASELVRKHDELSRIYMLVAVAKKEWEGTIDCVDDMLLLADPDGCIRRCNRVFREFTGKSYQEILGRPYVQTLREAGISAELAYGRPVEQFHEPSGKWFVLRLYPFRKDPDEAVAGSIVAIHDATEIKAMTGELEQKNARLNDALSEIRRTQSKLVQQEKMASIGQLAAGVAHEINNPIGFINSNLGTLGKYLTRLSDFLFEQTACIGAGSPAPMIDALRQKREQLKIDYILKDLDDLVRESLEGAERVRSIVADLKSFSRVDESDFKSADLNECLRSTINIVWNEIKYKATMKKELGEIPRTRCNPQQMNQVFMNLLVNAAHAIENRGEITVRSRVEDGSVCISVEDTGRGIPKENMDRIFEPFFTTKEVGQGTGLGLSITYDIVKKHRGDISVRSEPGKGTTFTVRIPVVEEV